jgi:hypothetical protein
MDGHQMLDTTLKTPEIPVWLATLNLEKSRRLVGRGIHEDPARRDSETLGRDTEPLSDQGDVGTNVNSTTNLAVVSHILPMDGHQEHQVGPL